MKLSLISLLSLALGGCASSPYPMAFGNNYYAVGDKTCNRVERRSDELINCYDKKGNLTGYREPLTTLDIQMYQARQAEESAALAASLNQARNSSQQTFNMAMGMVNQTQVGNLNATSYTRVQNSNGVWVYCIRTSSYTVNCRTQ